MTAEDRHDIQSMIDGCIAELEERIIKRVADAAGMAAGDYRNRDRDVLSRELVAELLVRFGDCLRNPQRPDSKE